jgi:hypothetical protein
MSFLLLYDKTISMRHAGSTSYKPISRSQSDNLLYPSTQRLLFAYFEQALLPAFWLIGALLHC